MTRQRQEWPPPGQPVRGRFFLNTRPRGFWLDDTHYPVRKAQWKQLLLGVCELLVDDLGEDGFRRRVVGLRGARHPHFSSSFGDLEARGQAPKRVDDIGLFAATKLNADDVLSRCLEVLDVCGRDRMSFQVET